MFEISWGWSWSWAWQYVIATNAVLKLMPNFPLYYWLESGSVLFLGETGQGAWVLYRGQYWGQLCVYMYCTLDCKFVLSLGSDPFTALFSHVVESWKSKNIRNLWLGCQNHCQKLKPRKIYTLTDWQKRYL